MKKKLLIAVLILLTVFSSCHEESSEPVNTGEISGYKLLTDTDYSTGSWITEVVTSNDTVVIFSKLRCGSVIIERKPIIK